MRVEVYFSSKEEIPSFATLKRAKEHCKAQKISFSKLVQTALKNHLDQKEQARARKQKRQSARQEENEQVKDHAS